MDEQFVIETHDLTKVYGDGVAIRALDGVNLSVHCGELIAIVGPSGSGKSTLLNMLGALDRPTSGEVIVNGIPLGQVRDLDRFRSQTVGFIFQTHNLIPTLTAAENIEVPMYESALSTTSRRRRARDLLELVGLAQRSDFLPNHLSGGERQRVAIARALANRPAIVLADEPTGNLDSQNTADIMALLVDLNATQNTTMLIVTHNHEVAQKARRVITFRDGKIQNDVVLHTIFESELLDFKRSALGQAIVRNEALAVGELRVTANPDGSLTIAPLGMGDVWGGFTAPSRWVEIAPRLFERVDQEHYAAFREDARGRVTHLLSGAGYHGTYRKLPWYETSTVQLSIAAVCLLVFLVTLIAWLASAVLGTAPAQPGLAHLARGLGVAVSALNLIGLLALVYALLIRRVAGLPAMAAGVSPLAATMLGVLLLAAVLGVGLAMLTVLAWKDEFWWLWGRLRSTLLTLVSLTFTWWLNEWNLLGFRY